MENKNTKHGSSLLERMFWFYFPKVQFLETCLKANSGDQRLKKICVKNYFVSERSEDSCSFVVKKSSCSSFLHGAIKSVCSASA
ncbi:MAG: hypothetical protein A2Y12_07410 [Planctomycetes bacterium GWF2_42_9]|nr:MAG: hypothetical protein A2Y12_07410 [Planctomycetes bacterium GWF2_42_9]